MNEKNYTTQAEERIREDVEALFIEGERMASNALNGQRFPRSPRDPWYRGPRHLAVARAVRANQIALLTRYIVGLVRLDVIPSAPPVCNFRWRERVGPRDWTLIAWTEVHP